MECLTPTFNFYIFLDYHFTSFFLLIHLGVNQILATSVLNKNRLLKCITAAKKRKVFTLSSAHQAREQCSFDQKNSRAVYIAFSESCKPKRFVRCRNEREHIQEQQPRPFHCYNLNTAFVNSMDQLLVKHRIDIRMKKWWWSSVV